MEAIKGDQESRGKAWTQNCTLIVIVLLLFFFLLATIVIAYYNRFLQLRPFTKEDKGSEPRVYWL